MIPRPKYRRRRRAPGETSSVPPPRRAAPTLLAILQMIKRTRASTNRYLADRKLEPPQINWAAIAEAWRRVKQ